MRSFKGVARPGPICWIQGFGYLAGSFQRGWLTGRLVPPGGMGDLLRLLGAALMGLR